MKSYQVYLLSFLIALTITYISTPLAEIIANKLGAVDRPDGNRKIHTRATPRLGGIAIYLGIVFSLISAVVFLNGSGKSFLLNTKSLFGIIIGTTFILFVGIADDFRNLKPYEKFVGQLIGSMIIIFFGITIDFITLPFGMGAVSIGFWTYPLTVIWMVAMMNIINFLDGLDGLAAGVVSISAFSFFLYLAEKGNLSVAILAIGIMGSCLGFLRYNFYPAKIFMGDSGSMAIGFLLGAVSIEGVLKSVSAFALMVPIIIMGVPILDTLLTIIRRAAWNKPITEADNQHIHHKLLHKGLGHRKAVLIIYFWSALLAGIGYAMSFLELVWKIGGFIILGAASVYIVWYTGIFSEMRIVIEERRNNASKK